VSISGPQSSTDPAQPAQYIVVPAGAVGFGVWLTAMTMFSLLVSAFALLLALLGCVALGPPHSNRAERLWCFGGGQQGKWDQTP
jgi:hypothetical protein